MNPYNRTIITNSIKGLNRPYNQDDVLILQEEKYELFVLFDGVSSYPESIDYIAACKAYIEEHHAFFLTKEKSGLRELIYSVHRHLLDAGFDGATTCCALLFYPDTQRKHLLNIGDSRAYAFSGTYLERLTKDDNLPGHKNILTKCLGGWELSYEDFVQNPVPYGPNFLLCSDGFYSLMEGSLKKYFQAINYKRKKNVIKAINRLQEGLNDDDSTYMIIRYEGI